MKAAEYSKRYRAIKKARANALNLEGPSEYCLNKTSPEPISIEDDPTYNDCHNETSDHQLDESIQPNQSTDNSTKNDLNVDVPENCMVNSDSEPESHNTNAIKIKIIEELLPNHDGPIPDDSWKEKLATTFVEHNLSHKAIQAILNVLRTVHRDLPADPRTFMKTKNIGQNIPLEGDETGKFIYFGIKQGLEKLLQNERVFRLLTSKRENVIELLFNVDGLPIYGNSKVQIWPILCKVLSSEAIFKPFAVGIYCGTTKPSQLNQYLRPFVREANHLQEDGFVVNGADFKILCKAFTCDTPARSFLKGTPGHNGLYSCERCIQRGRKLMTGEKKAFVFQEFDSCKRSDDSFRHQTQREHHKYRSPLVDLENFDLVKGFPLDYMHLLCIGVVKRIVRAWVTGTKKTKLHDDEIAMIDARIQNLHKHIPKEFHRKLRSIAHVDLWKATEARFFILYCAPIVIDGIVKKDKAEHFLKLHTAMRILCSQFSSTDDVEFARTLLKDFVIDVPKLYGEHFLVPNMHGLLHITDDVENLRCTLHDISAFPFENYLGLIKNLVRSPSNPLAQIARRFSEIEAHGSKESVIFKKDTKVEYKKQSKREKACGQKVRVKEVTHNCYYLSSKFPNDHVMLKDQRLVKITNIYENENRQIYITGHVFHTEPTFTVRSHTSEDVGVGLVTRNDREKISFELKEVEAKVIVLPRGSKKFALKMLH